MATDYKLRISAKDNTKGGFNSVNKNVNKTQQAMKKLAGAFAGAFAIRQIVQFGNESLQLADSIGKPLILLASLQTSYKNINMLPNNQE